MTVRLHISLYIAAGIVVLSACDDFNRFKQEKYECNWNQAGILEIELRSMKANATVNFLTLDGDQTGKLVLSNDKELIIEAPELLIRIDREKSLIRAIKGTRYHEIRCKKIEFKM
tara:strand:+ start:951 stop:1295 length:345 start_codon:yes stop_codon:yes gene_type:complete